jgi:hypothetical protein
MRKNINKIVAFAIGISIMSGSIMPVFAADATQNTNLSVENQNSQKPVLTLEDAIAEAIRNSETLALDDKKISYQDKTNDIKDMQDSFNKVSDDVNDYDDDTADIKLKKAKQQRDFDEDLLRKKVTDKYNDIVTSQIKIDKAAKDLAVKNKGLEDDEVRASLGMKRLIDVKTTKLDIQNLQNTQKTNENKLNDSEYSFNVLTNKDVKQYSLEKDVQFEPLKIDGSIDKYLDDSIDSYLKYTEQLVNINKDYYDKDYEKDNKITTDDMTTAETEANTAVKPVEPQYVAGDTDANFTKYIDYENKVNIYNATKSKYTGILAARLTYLNTKLSNFQDQTNLNENKKKFKDSLKGYYTDLLTSEDKINYLKKNIEITNENTSNLKLKYDLGMITESAYTTQVLSSDDLDIQLRSEIINYNTIKEKIQKPWISL